MKKILAILITVFVTSFATGGFAAEEKKDVKTKNGEKDGAPQLEVDTEEFELLHEMQKFFSTRPTEMVWLVQPWSDEDWLLGMTNLYGNVIVRQFTKKSNNPHGDTSGIEYMVYEAIYKTDKVYSTDTTTKSFTTVPTIKKATTLIHNLISDLCDDKVKLDVVKEHNRGKYKSNIFFTSCGKYKVTGRSDVTVHKVIAGDLGLYHIYRTKEASELDKKTKKKWADGLDKFKVCDNAVKGENCPKPKKK